MRIYPTFFNIFFKGMDPEKAQYYYRSGAARQPAAAPFPPRGR